MDARDLAFAEDRQISLSIIAQSAFWDDRALRGRCSRRYRSARSLTVGASRFSRRSRAGSSPWSIRLRRALASLRAAKADQDGKVADREPTFGPGAPIVDEEG